MLQEKTSKEIKIASWWLQKRIGKRYVRPASVPPYPPSSPHCLFNCQPASWASYLSQMCFPLCLISSKPSLTQQICNELALCHDKKKKWHHFQKGGDQHFNLSEIGNRTKEMSGRTERGEDGDGADAFFPSPRLAHRAVEIWKPFVSHSRRVLLAMQGLVWT